MKYWREFKKYKQAFKFIEENKPKLIVEYGSGGSTYSLYKCLEELNYGGKLITYEDNSEWYNDIISNFPFLKDSVKLVEIETVNSKKGYLRYNHNLEDIKEAELVILDGPDYKLFLTEDGGPSNVTTNLEDIVNYLGKEIPFFIDGREGCVRYYNNLNYTKHIIQPLEDTGNGNKLL